MHSLLLALALALLSANPSVAQNRPDGVPPPTLEERVERLEGMHDARGSVSHPSVQARTHTHPSAASRGSQGLAVLVLIYAIYLHGRIGDLKKELRRSATTASS